MIHLKWFTYFILLNYCEVRNCLYVLINVINIYNIPSSPQKIKESAFCNYIGYVFMISDKIVLIKTVIYI